MATLIAHFSEENAPIWQENTMVYTIANITLSPGTYYATFSKSGTVPKGDGSMFYYKYSLNLSGGFSN